MTSTKLIQPPCGHLSVTGAVIICNDWFAARLLQLSEAAPALSRDFLSLAL